LGGNRAFSGDIQLSGTNTIALFERDLLNKERQIFFNGRVSGAGITLNVFGASNSNPFVLAGGTNTITGTINLNPSAALEVRSPGSLGLNTGDVTVNMVANSRLLLRHWQDADYRANVVVNGSAEISADRLVNYPGGFQQILSINNLTVNGDNTMVTFGGGNNYFSRVGGTATLNGATGPILNMTGPVSSLKTASPSAHRAAPSISAAPSPASCAGRRITPARSASSKVSSICRTTARCRPSAPSTCAAGELRVESTALADRINNAAPITFGGGALRITGPETIGTVTAVAGTTQIAYNLISETVASALTLNGFTRATWAVVQFQADFTAVGAATLGSPRVFGFVPTWVRGRSLA
jgi:hypothetical protein